MTTFLLPSTPVTSLDGYLAADVGGGGVASAQHLEPAGHHRDLRCGRAPRTWRKRPDWTYEPDVETE